MHGGSGRAGDFTPRGPLAIRNRSGRCRDNPFGPMLGFAKQTNQPLRDRVIWRGREMGPVPLSPGADYSAVRAQTRSMSNSPISWIVRPICCRSHETNLLAKAGSSKRRSRVNC